MALQFKIALRNIFRNKRRSALTLLAIVFGSVAIIVFGGFIEASYQGLREATIHSRLGHLQIFRKGYEEHRTKAPEKYLLSPQEIAKIKKILAEIKGVQLVTTRLEFSGLLSNDNISIAVFGIGGEVEQEAEMSAGLTLVAGEELYEDEGDTVLMGKGLAQALAARPGDVLTLLGSTTDGAVNAVDVTVAGIFESFAKEYDDRAMRMNLLHTQNLLFTENVTKMVILLDDTERTEAVADEIDQRFQQAGLVVEIKTWNELAVFYHAVVKLYRGLFNFIQLIVMIIVVLGIANTMMMTVMERTPEIGTIRALGTQKTGVIQLFLLEGVLLGILGGIWGILLGMGAAQLISAAEFMMPPPPGSSRGFPITILIVPSVLFLSFVLAVGASFCSSIYPALKASQLKIVDALRFV